MWEKDYTQLTTINNINCDKSYKGNQQVVVMENNGIKGGYLKRWSENIFLDDFEADTLRMKIFT